MSVKYTFKWLFLLLLLAIPSNTYAIGSAFGFCEAGNQKVTAGGLISTTNVQKSYPQCIITVYNPDGVTSATIYSDSSATPLANPFTANTNGTWQFFAANGTYNIVTSAGLPSPGITPPVTTFNVTVFDPSAATGLVLDCSSPKYKGATAGAKIAACIAALPSTGAIADACAFQGAQTITQDIFAGAIGAGVLKICGATYTTAVSQNVPREWTIEGIGREVGGFRFTNVGDGFKSTWPINSSTAVNIHLHGFFIENTNGSNAGAGFDDVGGTYVRLDEMYFSGWKYDVIFDQTELSSVCRSDMEMGTNTTAGIWLVNGPAHTAMASYFFTNNITVCETQFNATAGTPIDIIDDGGVAHRFTNNNFNGAGLSTSALQGAGISGLVYSGNELEGHTVSSMVLTDGITAGIVGPVAGGQIGPGNYFGDTVTDQIHLQYANGLMISGNMVKGASDAFILFDGGSINRSNQNTIVNNSKLITGGTQTAANFIATNTSAAQRNSFTQLAYTFAVTGFGAGAQTVTPTTMEAIKLGARLWCINLDGTNGELVIVTAVAPTTFTATFASSKGTDFIIAGTTNEDQAAWTPVLAGSGTAGSVTYSVQEGMYLKQGNHVHIEGSLVTTAVGTSGMTGNMVITGLPYTSSNFTNNYADVTISIWTGFTFLSGYTVMSAIIEPNEAIIRLTGNGSAKVAEFITPQEITNNVVEIRFSAEYTASQ